MSATFTAKYDGRCAECKETIYTGDQLTWSDERQAIHLDCEPAEIKAKAPRPTCPKCWLIISTSGACGCDA